jgi:hypothetical protein
MIGRHGGRNPAGAARQEIPDAGAFLRTNVADFAKIGADERFNPLATVEGTLHEIPVNSISLILIDGVYPGAVAYS